MRLILQDEGKAQVYGLPTNDCEETELRAQLMLRGWTQDAATKHIDAAVSAGAYVRARETIYPARTERIVRARKEAQDKE